MLKTGSLYDSSVYWYMPNFHLFLTYKFRVGPRIPLLPKIIDRVLFSFFSIIFTFFPHCIAISLVWIQSEEISGIVSWFWEGEKEVWETVSLKCSPLSSVLSTPEADSSPYYQRVNQNNIFPRLSVSKFLIYWVTTSNNTSLHMWCSYLRTQRMLKIVTK